MDVRARLATCPDPKTADLYLPKKEWKELVTKLGSNRIAVILRFEG